MKITVRYTSVDGGRKTRSYKTLEGAQKFAQLYVGECPELGDWYAVSADGIGKVEVEGCQLADLFPKLARPEPEPVDEWDYHESHGWDEPEDDSCEVVCAECGRLVELLWHPSCGQYCPECGSCDPVYGAEIEVVDLVCPVCGKTEKAASYRETCVACERAARRGDRREGDDIPF